MGLKLAQALLALAKKQLLQNIFQKNMMIKLISMILVILYYIMIELASLEKMAVENLHLLKCYQEI